MDINKARQAQSKEFRASWQGRQLLALQRRAKPIVYGEVLQVLPSGTRRVSLFFVVKGEVVDAYPAAKWAGLRFDKKGAVLVSEVGTEAVYCAWAQIFRLLNYGRADYVGRVSVRRM